jgi:N-acetylmuramoyl-L-alanine amidase
LQNLGFKRVIVSSLLLGSALVLGSVVRGQTYYVQPGDSLFLIAARYGTSITALQQANRMTTSTIYPGQALTISPAGGTGTVTGSNSYITCSGDSLYLIAQRYGITVAALKEANNLSGDALLTGIQLVIPNNTAGNSALEVFHQVRSGESLYLIAQQYKITIEALKSANQITGDMLKIGQTLKIPSTTTVTSAAVTAATGSTKTYMVQNGDSIFLIAQKCGITMDSLLQANYLSHTSVLYPGQKLTIPASGTNTVSNATGSGAVYGDFTISANELDLFARLVSAEAGGESYEGQVAVAATILHRLTDGRYPKTITAIIYQVVNGYYQYSPVLDGRINETATVSAYNAVQQAIAGWDPSNGANGFYNPAKTTSEWVRSRTVTTTIGNHVFFIN